MATAKTNALRLLDAAGIAHRVVPYDLAAEDFSAEAVAEAIEYPPNRVFKTLAARVDESHCLAVVPGGAELDLKALAHAAGVKTAEMVPVADLERLTGYRRGSVTALATKRTLPVYLDESAAAHDTIAVSAGREGLQVELDPGEFARVTGAKVARIARWESGQ